MVDVLPLLAAVGVIVLWCLGLYGLQRRGLLEPHGLQPSPPPAGPFLMWKTVGGRQLIDRLARPKRFWRVFGDIAIVLVALTMLGTTVLLAWEATLVQNAAIRSNPPSPETLLGLPGINPIIPLGYGILGLAVAIILHEFSHGILSRVANIKIRSLGLIFLIFPIGAFVEPDEDELRALPRRERGRLYAVGPATNVLLSVLFAVLFSTLILTSVAPVHHGVGIVGFTPNSPAGLAGMQPDPVNPRLRVVALLRLLPARRSRDPLLPDPRSGGRDSSSPVLALRECVILAVLAQPDARCNECAARRPPRWRVPVQRRNRRTRLPPAKRHPDGAERSNRPRRELHVCVPDPRARPLAIDRAEDLKFIGEGLPSPRVR